MTESSPCDADTHRLTVGESDLQTKGMYLSSHVQIQLLNLQLSLRCYLEVSGGGAFGMKLDNEIEFLVNGMSDLTKEQNAL